MATHPYKPSDHSEEKPRYTGVSDLDDILDQTISVASGIGAGVLASISGALEQVGEAIGAARQKDENLPFPKWKRRMDRQLQKKIRMMPWHWRLWGGRWPLVSALPPL